MAIHKLMLKFTEKDNRPRIANSMLTEKNEVEKPMELNLETSYEEIATNITYLQQLRCCSTRERTDKSRDGTERSEISGNEVN